MSMCCITFALACLVPALLGARGESRLDNDHLLDDFSDTRHQLQRIVAKGLDVRLNLALVLLAFRHSAGILGLRTLNSAPCKWPLRSRRLPSSRRLGIVGLCSPASLEEELLALAAPTDRGVNADEVTRGKILQVIEQLEGAWNGTDAFSANSTDMLFRRTEVAYVGQSKSVKANAAGGKYRGRVGRFFFRTDALFQHVLADVAVNVIQFRLCGLIPGAAVLQGAWKKAEKDQLKQLSGRTKRALSSNTVFVEFERPRVCFGREGRIINLQFGPTSTVGLDITYLSPIIRICRGAGSGIPFVFRTDTCAVNGCFAAASQQWAACVSRRPLGKRALASIFLGIAGGCFGNVLPLPRITALPLLLVAGALLRSTGGIVVSRRTPTPIESKAA